MKESPFKTEEQKEMLREFYRLNQIHLDCTSKMHQLRKDFCKTLPFKVGDYVIFDKWIKRQGWITRMFMNEFFSNIFIYFNPPKKDGTPSKREEVALINVMTELDLITIDKTR